MKNKKVYIYGVLTCNRRKLDAWKLQHYLLKNEYEIVTNPKDADFIFLITCAYSNQHAETSLDITKKFLDYDSQLIVSGCLPEIEKEELSKIFNGKILSTKNLNQIDQIFPDNKIKFNKINDANIPLENSNELVLISNIKKVVGKSNKSKKLFNGFLNFIFNNMLKEESNNCNRSIINYSYVKYLKERLQPSITFYKDSFFIRPSWGCLGSCSYCVIKKAIGPLKSKSMETIITEFNKGLGQGYKNFIFDADDLGAYGADSNSNFVEMLNNVMDVPGDYSIHLRYIHPIWLVKYCTGFEKVLRQGKIKSLGSAIQSGNSRILKLMHRFSDVKQIKSTFSKLRNAYPNLLIATECINGFPTETKEEFLDTLNIIYEINFDWGFIFPFSCRPGSVAEKIEPKVPKQEILNRMNFAHAYFKNNGYNSSSFKNQNILVFSKTSKNLKFDEGLKSFCLSTIE